MLPTVAISDKHDYCGTQTITSRSRLVIDRAEAEHRFQEVTAMPLVNVKVIEGVFTSSQKQDMVRKLTDAMVEIEGEALRPVTWVVVEEVASGDWGMGGKLVTTSDVKATAAGQRVG
jgi:4-oxalocrotonate tautomerase